MAKIDEVSAEVARLVASFPRAEIGEATLKVYCEMLRDIPAPELRAATSALIGSCKFFPTIAEIRESWAKAKAGPKRSGLDAWGDVMREVRRVGYQGTPHFTDPAIQLAIRTLGGWRQLCESEDTMADRAHFARAYESIASRNLEAVQLGKAGLRPSLPAMPVLQLAPAAEHVDRETVAETVAEVLADLQKADGA